MFCPRCGTKAMTGATGFCYECGLDLGDVGRPREQGAEEETRERGDWRAGASAPPFARPGMALPRAIVGNGASRSLLSAVGLLTLLLLALPILAVVVLAGLFATVAFVGALVKLAPALLIGLLLYWVLAERGRMPRARRHYREI